MIGIFINSNKISPFPKEHLLCKDSKIHIRLYDYCMPMVISGFVDKLTFLVTYLLQGYIKTIKDSINLNDVDADYILTLFQDCCYEYKILQKDIGLRIKGYKGINILKEYTKINPTSKLGAVRNKFLPVGCDMTLDSLIQSFQQVYLSIDLMSILFNDSISIVLSDCLYVTDDLYSKYKNKLTKQKQKESKPLSVINLWGDENGDN